ncbi:uncharacterized protein CCOS01_17090 [Colletotrichum costaricense]|uniref:Uncharacterized protein n=1 Tax=Colletotrichum costaricense TaxID=1209916 RepID=A0AAJ0DR55_9PEZI|nr:uncharacterized protein CCOS01_17090 [Colletotrichum costaricense]KAK1503137.1 hypothetical protein CCOS01_17090 [Colletotrichum costaricense]
MYPAQSQRYPPSKPPRPSPRAAPYPKFGCSFRGTHPVCSRQLSRDTVPPPNRRTAISVSPQSRPHRHQIVTACSSVVAPDRHPHPREIIGPTPEPSDGYTAAEDEELARNKRIVVKYAFQGALQTSSTDRTPRTQKIEELTKEVVDIFMRAGSSAAVASPLLNHGGDVNQLT